MKKSKKSGAQPSPDKEKNVIDYNSKTMEITYNGKVIATWNDDALIDYPEDLTWDRDIGSLVKQVFKAGQDSKS